jgi:hypothetical protein
MGHSKATHVGGYDGFIEALEDEPRVPMPGAVEAARKGAAVLVAA